MKIDRTLSIPSVSAHHGRFFLGWIFLLAVLSAVSACSSLGLTPAKTFNDRAAYTYATISAVAQLAVSALEDKQITASEGVSIADALQGAMANMIVAENLHRAGNEKGALAQLAAINAVLRELQARMKSGGVQ